MGCLSVLGVENNCLPYLPDWLSSLVGSVFLEGVVFTLRGKFFHFFMHSLINLFRSSRRAARIFVSGLASTAICGRFLLVDQNAR